MHLSRLINKDNTVRNDDYGYMYTSNLSLCIRTSRVGEGNDGVVDKLSNMPGNVLCGQHS